MKTVEYMQQYSINSNEKFAKNRNYVLLFLNSDILPVAQPEADS
jgi:hypothetical protein